MTDLPARPLSLPVLSASQAQALTLIARHGSALRVVLPGGEPAGGAGAAWRLAFSPGPVDAVDAAAQVHASAEWAGARLLLSLPAQACGAWLAGRLGGLDPGELPAPLYAAALQAMLDEWARALGAGPSGPVRIVDLAEQRPDVAGLAHCWTLALQAEEGGQAVLASLRADALGLMLLAGLISRAAPAGRGEDDALQSLPVPLRAVVGSTLLSAGELASLRVRDAVLLDDYYVSQDGELALALPDGRGLRVRQDGSTLTITQGWTSFMTQPNDDQAAAAAEPAEPLALDALPVRLTFDLGERQVTLAQLRAMQPGETFDLERPLGGAVTVRANGAVIGTGDLVEIDGRVGVVLRSLGNRA